MPSRSPPADDRSIPTLAAMGEVPNGPCIRVPRTCLAARGSATLGPWVKTGTGHQRHRRNEVRISAPGRVLAVDETDATVALDGRIRRVSTLLVPDLAVGDQVLIAAGTVIRRLDPIEAADLAALLAIAREDAGPTNRRDLE